MGGGESGTTRRISQLLHETIQLLHGRWRQTATDDVRGPGQLAARVMNTMRSSFLSVTYSSWQMTSFSFDVAEAIACSTLDRPALSSVSTRPTLTVSSFTG